MRNVQQGDRVKVIAGNDKGKTGEVLDVLPSEGRVIVENINFRLKHKGRTQQHREPGIIEREEPIDISNVMPICPSCDQPTRVGYDTVAGDKVRICKQCGGTIE